MTICTHIFPRVGFNTVVVIVLLLHGGDIVVCAQTTGRRQLLIAEEAREDVRERKRELMIAWSVEWLYLV